MKTEARVDEVVTGDVVVEEVAAPQFGKRPMNLLLTYLIRVSRLHSIIFEPFAGRSHNQPHQIMLLMMTDAVLL